MCTSSQLKVNSGRFKSGKKTLTLISFTALLNQGCNP